MTDKTTEPVPTPAPAQPEEKPKPTSKAKPEGKLTTFGNHKFYVKE